MADQLEGGASGAAGGVAELAAALQAGAPAYFRDQDRQFFQVGQQRYLLEWNWQLSSGCTITCQHSTEVPVALVL